jgi:hypothetical protein
MKVRELLPTRRPNPTKTPTGKNWSEHKADLQEDFHSHCGYCGSYDGFRHTYFEVDHFVPKSLFEVTGHITYCQYDNLVYACKFCNNKKLAQWPSNDENVSNINDEGFIDPCDSEYDDHLFRTATGTIRWNTTLGKWIVEKGFKFDERDFSIKLLWELNQVRRILDKLRNELSKYIEGTDEYDLIYKEMEKISPSYYLLDSELIKYYNGQ